MKPKLLRITQEDLADAMQHAGLINLIDYDAGDVTESSAAFAAMGHGLCSFPQDIHLCQYEEAGMDVKLTLTVRLTNSSLTVIKNMFKAVLDQWEYKAILNYDLGLEVSHLDPVSYWNNVQAAIFSVATVNSMKIETLLLLGEAGLNERLLDTIHKALGERSLLPLTNIQLSTFPDPVYAAARGAAELAKRFQEMPRHCTEPEHCFSNVSLVLNDDYWGDF